MTVEKIEPRTKRADDLRALLEDLRAHFEPKADVEYDDGSPKPNAAKRFLDRIDEELEAQ